MSFVKGKDDRQGRLDAAEWPLTMMDPIYLKENSNIISAAKHSSDEIKIDYYKSSKRTAS